MRGGYPEHGRLAVDPSGNFRIRCFFAIWTSLDAREGVRRYSHFLRLKMMISITTMITDTAMMAS